MHLLGGVINIHNCGCLFFGVDMQSLCGHTSPVESVAFDTSEVLVLAGASMGAIKLWDLEEAKSKLIDWLYSLLKWSVYHKVM